MRGRCMSLWRVVRSVRCLLSFPAKNDEENVVRNDPAPESEECEIEERIERHAYEYTRRSPASAGLLRFTVS